MRTSIRDPGDPNRKNIIVPDQDVAEYLQSKFPGSRIERLDIGMNPIARNGRGRPRRYKSNAERVAVQRRNAQEKKLEILQEQILCQIRQDHSQAGWVYGNKPNGRTKNTIGVKARPFVYFPVGLMQSLCRGSIPNHVSARFILTKRSPCR
jgi:hypothetical protein